MLLATPAGSSAYNLSVDGPILPLDSPLMALTPISAFRPRRWRGALLPDTAHVTLDVLEAEKRPVAAVADHFEFKEVVKVEIAMDHATNLVILHDPGHSLDERILREQFGFQDERQQLRFSAARSSRAALACSNAITFWRRKFDGAQREFTREIYDIGPLRHDPALRSATRTHPARATVPPGRLSRRAAATA